MWRKEAYSGAEFFLHHAFAAVRVRRIVNPPLHTAQKGHAMKSWGTALFLGLLSTLSAGQAPSINVATIQGLSTCGEYLEVRKSDEVRVNVILGWTSGYLSAYNLYGFFSAKPGMAGVAIPDRLTTLAYIDKHCSDKPLDSVLGAMAALVADLGGYRPPFVKKP